MPPSKNEEEDKSADQDEEDDVDRMLEEEEETGNERGSEVSELKSRCSWNAYCRATGFRLGVRLLTRSRTRRLG